MDQDYVEHLYGSAALYGYDSRETVTLDLANNTRVTAFEFFEIYKQYGLMQNIDGILGMSRKWIEPGKFETGPLFIEALYNTSKISQQIFGVNFENNPRDSFIDIGYFNESCMRGGSTNLRWFSIPSDRQVLFWYLRTTAIRFGSFDLMYQGISQAYMFDKYLPAILDTGTSMLMIPNVIAADFFGRLLQG